MHIVFADFFVYGRPIWQQPLMRVQPVLYVIHDMWKVSSESVVSGVAEVPSASYFMSSFEPYLISSRQHLEVAPKTAVRTYRASIK